MGIEVDYSFNPLFYDVEVTNDKPSQEVTVKQESNSVEITVEYVKAITLTEGSVEKVYNGKEQMI